MRGAADDELIPGLPVKVVERLRTELPGPAERIVRCLRTAAELLEQAETDVRDLRLAESAAYNLREALDSVVKDKDAAQGGFGAVMDAWQKCKTALGPGSTDSTDAVAELVQALTQLEADRAGESYYARKLLTHLRDRSGIDQPRGVGNPISEYTGLRDKANTAVHTEFALADVTSLFANTVAWFVRMFTPPDDLVDAIRDLAAQPWRSQDQIAALTQLAMNDHHLRLFFSEITDPAWLDPLYHNGFVQLPSRDRAWPPMASLVEGLGRTQPHTVAALLERMLPDIKQLPPDQRAFSSLQLVVIAVQLGVAGHKLVTLVVQQYGTHPSIRSLSVHVARQADPAAPVVLNVADAVLNYFERFADGDTYNATTVLDQLQAGVLNENIASRAGMLGGKLRRRVNSDTDRYIELDSAALTIAVGDVPEPQLLFAHHLAHILSKARQLGVPSRTQLEWLTLVPGDVGGRLRSHVLAGAEDMPLPDKVDHIATRLASRGPTAEDLALVADITAHSLRPDDLAAWAAALGTPSPAPGDGTGVPPADWVRAWRWAAVLPKQVFTSWDDPLERVSDRRGRPDSSALTGPRTSDIAFGFVGPPHTAGQLAAMPVPEAATLVASWRPDTNSRPTFTGRLDLARALTTTVSNNPSAWSVEAEAVVETLREPIYLEHYLRGLIEKSSDVVPYATSVLAAAAQARSMLDLAPPEPGSDGEESDPSSTQLAVLELVEALANRNADIAASLDELWDWSEKAVAAVPEADQGLLYPKLGPLASATSRLWGRGLMTALALAAWEFRNQGTLHPAMVPVLNSATAVPGSAGLEFRAVLAHQRPRLEEICPQWLDERVNVLFREGPQGRETFELTVKWAAPTPWFYAHLTPELFDAALRGADQATREVVIALLDQVDGYDHDTVIQHLRKNPAILAAASEQAAFLVQKAAADAPWMAVAVEFWTRLLDEDRTAVPADALRRLGRWASVTNLDDQEWATLTARTVAITNGHLSHVILVADRVADIPPSPTTREILLRMLDKGEQWEQRYIADTALGVLRASASCPVDDSFELLRTRLINLGYFQARDIIHDQQIGNA